LCVNSNRRSLNPQFALPIRETIGRIIGLMSEPLRIPYPFILEHLTAEDIVVKPMFGGYAVYSDAKLCLFMVRRDLPVLPRPEGADQNGIYVATTRENVPSLTPVFENAEIQFLKGDKVWIFISESKANFEEYTIRACELVAARNRRIGR